MNSLLNAISQITNTTDERFDILREHETYTDTSSTIHLFDKEGIDYICSFSQKDFIEKFFTGCKWKELGNGDTTIGDARKHAKAVLTHALKIKRHGYQLPINYKHGRSSSSGRLYDDGFGTQILNKELRTYFQPELYHDYDMSNAHPTLLLWICKELKLSCERLAEYVNDRAQVLKDSNTTKQSILTMINCDKHRKSDNVWIQAFCDELTRNKERIVSIIANDFNSSPNSKHPMSSKMNKLLCDLENRCLHAAMQSVDVNNNTVLMFDGFMCTRELKQDEIDDMNTATELFGIKWCEKTWTKGVIPESYKNQDDRSYDGMKAKFEQKHFIVTEPQFAYWMETSDGARPISRVACVDASRKYWYKNDDGKKTKLFDDWLEDENARTFRKVVYVPYSNHFPADVAYDEFNTAPPFTFDYIQKEDRDETALQMFTQLVAGLSENADGQQYTIDYFAHMIQKPTQRPEIMLLFKSHGGSGKDTLTKTITKILGEAQCETVDDMGLLFGRFNSCIANKLFITMNEVDGKDGSKYIEKLKNRLTAEKMTIEFKSKDTYSQVNIFRSVCYSNNSNPIPIESGSARRLHCNQVAADSKLSGEFFDKYYAALEDRHWLNSLASELCDIDLTDFKVRRPPKSSSLASKIQDKIHPLHKFLQDICECKHTTDVYTTIPKKPNCIGIEVSAFNRAYRERLTEQYPTGFDQWMTDKTYINNVFGNYHNIIFPKIRKSVEGTQKHLHIIDPQRMLVGLRNRCEYTIPQIDEDE